MAAIKPEGASLAAWAWRTLRCTRGNTTGPPNILELAITNDAHFGNRPALANKYLALAEARVGQGRPS